MANNEKPTMKDIMTGTTLNGFIEAAKVKPLTEDKEYLRPIIIRLIEAAPEGWFSIQWMWRLGSTEEKITRDWFENKQELFDFLKRISMSQVLRIEKMEGGAFTKVEQKIFDSYSYAKTETSVEPVEKTIKVVHDPCPKGFKRSPFDCRWLYSLLQARGGYSIFIAMEMAYEFKKYGVVYDRKDWTKRKYKIIK